MSDQPSTAAPDAPTLRQWIQAAHANADAKRAATFEAEATAAHKTAADLRAVGGVDPAIRQAATILDTFADRLTEAETDRDWYRRLHEEAAGRAQRVADTAERLIAEARAELDQQKAINNGVATAFLNDPGHAAGYAEAVAWLRDGERYKHWWSSSPESVRPTEPIRGHLADYLETVGPDGPDISKPLAARESRTSIHAATVLRITKLLGTADDAEFREGVQRAILDGRAKLSQPPTVAETKAVLGDDGLCGDCVEGRCHGGEDDDDCGCARHAASVEARA